MAGSSTPWKATAPSPTVSTVLLACVSERKGYLWGGFCVGVPLLVVVLGVVLVDGVESLRVAPSEVLEGRYCAAA